MQFHEHICAVRTSQRGLTVVCCTADRDDSNESWTVPCNAPSNSPADAASTVVQTEIGL